MLRIDQPLLLLNGKNEMFFEPVQFYFQLADLLIQLRDQILSLLVLFPSAIRKDLWKLFQELLSPLSNLIRMSSNFTGQSWSWQATMHHIPLSSFWAVLYCVNSRLPL
jgi:hypothetical protein